MEREYSGKNEQLLNPSNSGFRLYFIDFLFELFQFHVQCSRDSDIKYQLDPLLKWYDLSILYTLSHMYRHSAEKCAHRKNLNPQLLSVNFSVWNVLLPAETKHFLVFHLLGTWDATILLALCKKNFHNNIIVPYEEASSMFSSWNDKEERWAKKTRMGMEYEIIYFSILKHIRRTCYIMSVGWLLHATNIEHWALNIQWLLTRFHIMVKSFSSFLYVYYFSMFFRSYFPSCRMYCTPHTYT